MNPTTKQPAHTEEMNAMNVFLCPLCKSNSRQVFVKYEVWLRDCDTCKHRFAEVRENSFHVAQVYDDSYFDGGGAGYDDYLSEAELLRSAGKRYGEIVKRFATAGNVLDVGAAAGFILQGFYDANWRGRGIEPNARMAGFARDKNNLDVVNSSVETYEDAQQFDLISLIQVIAHFQNPVETLAKLALLTKPNGFMLIETWRRDSLTARFFGESWHEYSPPSVLHWFTKPRLQSLVESFGFKTVASGKPSKWINAAHAKSLVRYKLQDVPAGRFLSKGLNVIPDKANCPYPAEDLFWLLCRKSESNQ